ncbi:acyl-CoA dehydrogenase [Mycobacterium sp. JS623]|uniref:acyl-CoA dehydrogenase family protein n=1 Tax=Mycobacterium sp. JS623 TaxID=212767 RepID=UPI0002A59F55|nr:acyl-CoA dehydrogenase family protein [Mycobacterium sp. JS623]AGB23468.1 acyl-CoA dehydrogenase [Mycobacterium sp. JS623]
MNLELTDEQLALRDTVRRFLAEKASLSTHVRAMLDSDQGITGEVWRGLADLGAIGVLVPQEFGGAGMTMVEAGVVAEELGAALHSGPWLSTAVAATRALTRMVDPAVAGPLLTRIADGTSIATFGPLDGARAVIERGLVCGWVDPLPDAIAADVALVLVDDGGRTALFAVDANQDGICAAKRLHVDPTRKLFNATFDAVPGERLALVSREDIEATVDDVLIAYAADALGAATAVMTMAVEYAKVRRQFDQPIGSFQAVQHMCVDMYETVELARSGVIHGLWAADAAQPGERHLAAVRAKAFAGQLASVADTAIQIFGGIGYTWEHDAHLYLKRLLGWSIFLGRSDKYLQEVGRALR